MAWHQGRGEVLPLRSVTRGKDSKKSKTGYSRKTGNRNKNRKLSVVEVHGKFGKGALLVRKDRLKFPQLQSGIILSPW